MPELKTMITERMRAESIADAPADPQHLRLCELGMSVFCDDETVHEAFGGVMNGSEKVGVSVRDSPEDKTGHGQKVVWSAHSLHDSFVCRPSLMRVLPAVRSATARRHTRLTRTTSRSRWSRWATTSPRGR